MMKSSRTCNSTSYTNNPYVCLTGEMNSMYYKALNK